jgi:hypothetical protein
MGSNQRVGGSLCLPILLILGRDAYFCTPGYSTRELIRAVLDPWRAAGSLSTSLPEPVVKTIVTLKHGHEK